MAAGLAVVVVWDGLRPDVPSPWLTPNLWALRERGTWFANSHAVFPTETRCNAATMATGSHPGTHGLVANQVWAPEVDRRSILNAGEKDPLVAFHRATEGRLLLVPSLGEILTDAGGTLVVGSAGSMGSAFLWNHRAAEGTGLVVNWLMSQPDSLLPEVERRFGKAPQKAVPNNRCCDWANEVFLDYLLPIALGCRPAVATLWMSEPDVSQHATGLGTPEVSAGLRGNDARLGRLLRRLAELGVGIEDPDGADCVLLSDHGFCNTYPAPSTAATVAEVDPEAVCSYLGVWNCAAQRDAVARHLQRQEWVGSLLARPVNGAVPAGCLPLAAVNQDGPRGGDLMVSFTWSDEARSPGLPGTAANHSKVNKGNHGTLAPYDLHNTMLACGPSFRRGCESSLPSGNVDLAPTLLHLLGLERPAAWDGRVLREALADGKAPTDVRREVLQASADLGDGAYQQELEASIVEGVRYLERGSARRARG